MPLVRMLAPFLLALAACNPAQPDETSMEATGGAAGYGNAGFGGTQLGSGGAGGLGDSDAGTECERHVRITAVMPGEPAPFDLILVADHSQSLSWSREDLARGLSTLLEHARGRSARIFVLTPTQYGASSAAAIDRFFGGDMVLWRDAGSGEAFTHAMTEYTQTCADADGAPIECPPHDPASMQEFSADGTWSFALPEPIAAIDASMSDAEIEAQQAAVADAILELGGTGSPNEQPLCTLNRYLLQSAQLPEHAVFVVISDEDDATDPDDCVTEYHYERTTRVHDFAEVCDTADCDAYQYLLFQTALNQPISYACTPVDDLGNPLAEGSFDRNTWLNGSLASDCTEVAPDAPCGPGALDWAETDCGSGYIVSRCTSSCAEAEVAGCVLTSYEDGIDFCTQAFEHAGQSFANLEAYCDATVMGEHSWLRCERRGFRSGSQQQATQQTVPLVAGDSAQALIDSFNQEAALRFGPEGYFAAVIGFHPGDACTPQQGQSAAINLARIASSPDALFPICGDYAPALESVRDFTESLVDPMHALSLAPDERIETVFAEREDGSRRALDASVYSYDRAEGVLTLLPGALLPMEIGIAVEIEKTCVMQPD